MKPSKYISQFFNAPNHPERASKYMHYYAKTGAIDILDILIDHFNLDINARDYLDNTPLITAISYKKRTTAYFLIKKGADIHHFSGSYNSALLESARQDCLPMITHLINCGTDPMHNPLNDEGFDFLDTSVRSWHNNTWQLCYFALNECRIDPNVRDSDGKTVPHLLASFFTESCRSCNHGDKNVYEKNVLYYLRESDCRLDIRDNDGRTAYDVAIESGAINAEIFKC